MALNPLLKKYVVNDWLKPAPTIESQQQGAASVLKILRDGGLQAFVAGGAARDWYLGNTCADIDVYVQSIGLADPEMMKKLADIGLPTQIKLGGGDYDGDPNLESVSEIWLGSNIFQIMVVNDLDRVIPEFPLSICQAWWDGELHTMPVFDDTIKTKVITKTGELYAVPQRYLDKIAGKFPDYKREGW